MRIDVSIWQRTSVICYDPWYEFREDWPFFASEVSWVFLRSMYHCPSSLLGCSLLENGTHLAYSLLHPFLPVQKLVPKRYSRNVSILLKMASFQACGSLCGLQEPMVGSQRARPLSGSLWRHTLGGRSTEPKHLALWPKKKKAKTQFYVTVQK